WPPVSSTTRARARSVVESRTARSSTTRRSPISPIVSSEHCSPTPPTSGAWQRRRRERLRPRRRRPQRVDRRRHGRRRPRRDRRTGADRDPHRLHRRVRQLREQQVIARIRLLVLVARPSVLVIFCLFAAVGLAQGGAPGDSVRLAGCLFPVIGFLV